MPRTLAILLFAAMGVGVPLRSATAGPASQQEQAEALYDQGRKAYRLGDYKTAVDKWQQAYDIAESMPDGAVVAALLLYNISLGYKGLYSITKDIADLRRARAVIDNFITIANANPDVELDDAEDRRAELDDMIAKAEEAERQNRPPPPQPKTADTIKSVDLSEDPGRKLRLAGIGTMAAGGALVITGVAFIAYYGVKGREFSEKLRIDNASFEDGGCDPDALVGECEQLDANIRFYRTEGRRANNLQVAFGAAFGGLGAVALIAGGLIFNEGNKRTKQWEKATRASFRLLPAPRGIVLTGRF